MYIPITRKIISICDFYFYENISSALAYTSRSYSEAMDMRPSVKYTPCATSSREETGDIITFVQFEEGNILSETHNNAESGDKSYEDSIVPSLLSKEETDAMNSGDESDDDLISTEMLEDIRDRSQSHPNVNRRKTRYKVCDRFNQRQSEWKLLLKATQSMGKVLHKVFKTVVKEILQYLPPSGESGSEIYCFITKPRTFLKLQKF